MKNRNVKTPKREKILITVLGIVGILICLPFVWEAFYALPDGDDFNAMYRTESYLNKGMGYWKAAFYVTKDFYCSWQGTYSGNMLETILSPFLRGGMKGYSLTCALFVVLFCVEIFILVMLIDKYLLGGNNICYHLANWNIIMILFFSLSDISQTFYWFSSMSVYLIPMMLGSFGAGLLLIGLYKNEKQYFAFSGILGIIACGGTLSIACFVCWIYLLLVVVSIVERKNRIKCLGVFGCSVLGTLINLRAPGYWVRKSEQINTEFNLSKAVLDTGIVIGRAFYRIISNPVFWICLVFLLLLNSYMSLDKYDARSNLKLGLVLIGGVGGACSLVFPFVFGYGMQCMFPRQESMFIICFSIYLAFLLPIILRYFVLKGIKFQKIGPVACLLAIIVTMIFGSRENYVMRAYREVCSGKPQLSYTNWEEIYTTVEESEDKVVYISIDNEFIDDLLVSNTYAHYGGEIFLSPSYIRYTGKDDIVIQWEDSEVR